MTANELADELDRCSCVYYDSTTNQYFDDIELSKKIATMLRQQAQEIERYHNMLHDKDVEITTLKQIIDANNLMSDIGQFKKAREK